MEKAPPARPFPPFLFLRKCSVMPYPLNLWIRSESVVCVQATPAAAERQERERPSERGGVISPELAFSTDAPQPHVFSCCMKHFPDNHTHANIVSQYTLR